MKLSVQHAGLTDKGQVRKANEDSWSVDPSLQLFIVADGLGGEFAGALAAKAVVAALPILVRQQLGAIRELQSVCKPRMEKALSLLSTHLRQQTRDEPGLDGMGSTVVCALVLGGRVLISHMGDSRAYLFAGGQLTQLTTDHTLVQVLLHSGDITAKEAATHPSRGRLTRSVGMKGEPLPQSRLLKLYAGDLFLLCSDGLTGMLSDLQIFDILKEPMPLKTKCQRLIDAANSAGGEDNVTVVLLSVVDEKETPHTNGNTPEKVH